MCFENDSGSCNISMLDVCNKKEILSNISSLPENLKEITNGSLQVDNVRSFIGNNKFNGFYSSDNKKFSILFRGNFNYKSNISIDLVSRFPNITSITGNI